MQFALDRFTLATCTHVNKRTENHGNELVHSKDLFWKVEGPNTLLDLLNPSLRAALYRHNGTKAIPGVEETTPELRSEMLEGPFSVKYEGSGYMLTVKYGEVSNDQLELGGVELAKFKVDPKQGGTSQLFFRSSHTGLTMEQMGRLDTFDGKQLHILLAPPAMQTGTPGKKDKKAHKPADDKTAGLVEPGTSPFKHSQGPDGKISGMGAKDPAPDAGDIFSATHGKKEPAAAAPVAKPTRPAKLVPPAKKTAIKKAVKKVLAGRGNK